MIPTSKLSKCSQIAFLWIEVKAEILRPEFLEASSSSGPVTSTSFSSPENPPNNHKVQCDPQLFILSQKAFHEKPKAIVLWFIPNKKLKNHKLRTILTDC
jgi:hypothetical protein